MRKQNNMSGMKFEDLAVPMAFINGLFFGGYALRKMRQYWEGGPRDQLLPPWIVRIELTCSELNQDVEKNICIIGKKPVLDT